MGSSKITHTRYLQNSPNTLGYRLRRVRLIRRYLVLVWVILTNALTAVYYMYLYTNISSTGLFGLMRMHLLPRCDNPPIRFHFHKHRHLNRGYRLACHLTGWRRDHGSEIPMMAWRLLTHSNPNSVVNYHYASCQVSGLRLHHAAFGFLAFVTIRITDAHLHWWCGFISLQAQTSPSQDGVKECLNCKTTKTTWSNALHRPCTISTLTRTQTNTIRLNSQALSHRIDASILESDLQTRRFIHECSMVGFRMDGGFPWFMGYRCKGIITWHFRGGSSGLEVMPWCHLQSESLKKVTWYTLGLLRVHVAPWTTNPLISISQQYKTKKGEEDCLHQLEIAKYPAMLRLGILSRCSKTRLHQTDMLITKLHVAQKIILRLRHAPLHRSTVRPACGLRFLPKL